MKSINLVRQRIMTFSIDARTLQQRAQGLNPSGPRIIPLGEVRTTDAKEDQEVALRNAMQVIYAFADIENRMGEIIVSFLFPQMDDGAITRQFFRDQILNARLSSFEARKSLIDKAAAKSSLLSKKHAKEFRDIAARLGQLRNAFAHGQIHYHADDGCVLVNPTKNAPSTKLSDAFWTKTETEVGTMNSILDRLESKLH